MALVRAALRRLSFVPYLRRVPAMAFSKEATIPTDQEQATGLEKEEIDALMAGNEDPFNMKVDVSPHGTKENPKQVFSIFDERLVGCICEEDATYVNWMKLTKGEPQRCECGHWFQLAQK